MGIGSPLKNKNMPSKTELLNIVERFGASKMLVVGDLILDHYIWGKVSRISPEAPVVVVKTTKETRTPGGAANVANNLIKLGASVSIAGFVGDDSSGATLVEQLKELGANTDGVFVDPSRMTSSKSRVIAHSQQVVRVDREESFPYDRVFVGKLNAHLKQSLDRVSGIIVSDYAKGVVSDTLFDLLREAKEQGKISLNKCPLVVDPKAPNYPFYKGASVIKPNRAEAEDASGVQITDRVSAEQAARILLDKWACELVLITLGEGGMLFVTRDAAEQIPTRARQVFDVSGAGDTVSAVFALALAVGGSPLQAAVLSNIAAGVVVAEIGTVPILREQLVEAIQQGVQ